VARWW